MPITADKVRELAARGERSTLDYKLDDYNWSEGKSANAELAKDLMAIANLLGPTSEPGHILIGVDETSGEIVGITTPHQDDADLQQKVKALLLRAPVFVYGSVDVDGRSVGVYEIRPGRRPIYPLRDSGTLQKHIAHVRSGTSTAIATPDEIQGWLREDDPVATELRTLELAEARARATVHGVLSFNMSSGGNGATIGIGITNHGRSGFFVDAIDWVGEWTQRFTDQLRIPLLAGYVSPRGSIPRPFEGLLPPGKTINVDFRYARTQALEHFREHSIVIDGFVGNWLAYHFVVRCRTDVGTDGVITGTARQ